MTRQTSDVRTSAREAILMAARKAAQARGYAGLNFRELADVVGIRHASLYYHFATKGDLGAAVARRYWEDTADALDKLLADAGDPLTALSHYPEIFRKSLQDDNRLCLASFMAAEYEDLPGNVKAEVLAFADINVAWLTRVLIASGFPPEEGSQRAQAIHAAVAGAQLVARARADLSLFDALIAGYRRAGLLAGGPRESR